MLLEPLAVSPREAAAMLSISRRSVSRLISARKLTARKHGARTLVDIESVKAFYASADQTNKFANCVRPPRQASAGAALKKEQPDAVRAVTAALAIKAGSMVR